MSNNPGKYEVLIKHYMRSILDISATRSLGWVFQRNKMTTIFYPQPSNSNKLSHIAFSFLRLVESLKRKTGIR